MRKPMTKAEAGRKGGRSTSREYGREHYVALGRKGGGRVAELVRRGREAEARG